MLLPKSSRVCIPCFKSVATRIYLVKVPFLAFLGPDMETEMGVVIYMHLKHLLDFIDSKYIWVHGSIYLSSSVFTEIPFLVFYFQSEVVYTYQVLNLWLLGFFWQKYHFWLFLITMVTIFQNF